MQTMEKRLWNIMEMYSKELILTLTRIKFKNRSSLVAVD